MKAQNTSRRTFLKKSAMTATGVTLAMQTMGAPLVKNVLGANDKIRMGFIGVGNRGSQLLSRFMKNKDVDVVALCDVYEPYTLRDRSRVNKRWLKELGGRIPRMGEKFDHKVDTYSDFRKLLERKDIDAVCIATPDHWHALQTIMACEAGKDVYVEKPLTITILEGRRMIEAAKRTNRIVQVGLNRRGSTIYQELARQVGGGSIGKVSVARAYRISNMYPDGIGHVQPESPPVGFDWDMWLGPRSFRPYQYNIAPYRFRWWKDYSSQMANWGVHYLDLIRWLIGEQAPRAVTAVGGKYILQDDRTIPDTMEVTFEFPSGAVAIFGVYEAAGGKMFPYGEVEFRGTLANLYASARGYRIEATEDGQFQDRGALTESVRKDLDPSEDITVNLIRNFLDSVKSRKKPWCDLEEGHRSTTFALLANISLEVGKRLEWDAEKERITNCEEANQYLHYEYRKPWTLG